MSSSNAPVFERKVDFIERVIERLIDKGYPDRVVSRIVIPMMTGEISANTWKARQLRDQVCESQQDVHSFNVHFLGMD